MVGVFVAFIRVVYGRMIYIDIDIDIEDLFTVEYNNITTLAL